MMTCPICKKKVVETDPEFPFCSERCKWLDLAQWADGGYRVPGEAVPEPSEREPVDGDTDKD